MSAHAESGKTTERITPALISTDLAEVTQMLNEVDTASTTLRYNNGKLCGITDIEQHIRRAEIGSMLGVPEVNHIRTMLNRKNMLTKVFDEFEEDEVELSHIPVYITGLPDIHFL